MQSLASAFVPVTLENTKALTYGPGEKRNSAVLSFLKLKSIGNLWTVAGRGGEELKDMGRAMLGKERRDSRPRPWQALKTKAASALLI